MSDRVSPDLAERFARTRNFTALLAEPLSPEDMLVQSMPDASPAKWHLAHTTWFFEAFVLGPAGEAPFDPAYGYLFNSYYEAVGPRHERPRRGILSRPTASEVLSYREDVDARMMRCIEGLVARDDGPRARVVELGLHHEQQHQELLLTDIKHAFGMNPLRPAYRKFRSARAVERPVAAHSWVAFEGGRARVGHRGPGFAFDNEGPEHDVHVMPFELASRLVTNGEYVAFIEDGGYARPEHWLSDGFAKVRDEAWDAPLYWKKEDGGYTSLTLDGVRPIAPEEPVCHVSFYEADAFARWSQARLPTEFEWESVARRAPVEGNLVESNTLHPRSASLGEGVQQLFGDVWEWTMSAYSPYPGFRPLEGALGEYNGKFMCNQLVLRGGSCVTSAEHVRSTYRNFFPPDARWQFSGIRLARTPG